MEMTYHVQVQRANRVQQIIDKIGIGQVVREKYSAGKYLCVTDTGIMLIKSEDKQKLITMYVATYRELVALYNGPKKIPPFLRKRVDHNQSLFTQAGKTIWR